jgi:hypothetical protein
MARVRAKAHNITFPLEAWGVEAINQNFDRLIGDLRALRLEITNLGAGTAGPTGSAGPPGELGEAGDPGDAGPPGLTGPTGPAGSIGPEGPAGFGPPGIDGEDGDAGPPGVPGPTGVSGSVGPEGPAGFGPPGLDGEDGDPGPPGVPGPTGVSGSIGPAGPAGSAGPPGVDGEDGETIVIPGPQGPAGAGGGGGGTTGSATLNFGAFPGASDAAVAVASATIGAGDRPDAWLFPSATADHSADEHMLETIKVFAHSVVAGVGFTISGFNRSEHFEPLEWIKGPRGTVLAGALLGATHGFQRPSDGGKGTRIYGQWTVAWRY